MFVVHQAGKKRILCMVELSVHHECLLKELQKVLYICMARPLPKPYVIASSRLWEKKEILEYLCFWSLQIG